MKPAAIVAVIGSAFAASAVLAAPALAADVTIRNAVARVIVIPEDRTDIGVEITQGAAGLPDLRVERRGSDVSIEGGLGRGRGMSFNGGLIGSCHNSRAEARQPGEGSSVEVRGKGRIRMEDAPMIVLRTPRDVEVSGGGALFGSIGRGARSVELGNGGCGSWTVANVDGDMDLSVGGSGSIRAGTSRKLEAAVGGSGSIFAGATGVLDASVGGSGSIDVARVDGETDIAIGGSGDVRVRGGRAPSLKVSIGGSGDVVFNGTAGDVSTAIAGSGDVQVAEATGRVSRSIVGSGNLRIGR
ncbi:GIN domain-containing protein [Brevundimonas diminuta]|uniref:GIN domain-containing protein n=1 Tax=Brevundimonas diminuta TaxID=293 RepID=UPI0032092C3C